MRILINSNLLHGPLLLAETDLPTGLPEFCRDARGAGAVIVFPKTALLEHQRMQNEVAASRAENLRRAGERLRAAGVTVPAFDADELSKPEDLCAMLRATGIPVEVEAALLADYEDAERRACLHLAPRSPQAKSDEMRDLVIWSVALRVARRDGRALLVSGDEIHSGVLGDGEAAEEGLLRARNFDEALDLLGSESPTLARAKDVLSIVWASLREAGLPLVNDAAVRRLRDVAFIIDDEGYLRTKFGFELPTLDGRLAGTALIYQSAPQVVKAELSDLSLNGAAHGDGKVTVEAAGHMPRGSRVLDERLQALRKLIGMRQ